MIQLPANLLETQEQIFGFMDKFAPLITEIKNAVFGHVETKKD